MTRAEAYRALAERLRAYAHKPEAADYVAEFKQLAKCYCSRRAPNGRHSSIRRTTIGPSRGKNKRYSVILPAQSGSAGGMFNPITLAAFRLTTSYFARV